MKKIIYFIEFVIVYIFFTLFKLFGYRVSSNFGFLIGKFFGPIFRSKKLIIENIKKSNISMKQNYNNVANNVLGNYGRILAEYPYLKDFRKNKLKHFIEIDGFENLTQIKDNNKPVVFISGHFNNFELMAMQLENSGLNVAAIYRPLNNIFLNTVMEKIRINHICKKQLKKGKSGTRELIKLFRDGYSVALMIDQRVSEGLPVKFFNRDCLTTTIPAQLVKKYDCEVVPIYIERIEKHNFKMSVNKPIIFEKELSLENITQKLNQILENMVLKNPEQWIWSHNRWK